MERYVSNDVFSALRSIDCSLKSLTLMKIEEMKKQGYEIKTEWLPGGDYSPEEVANIKGIPFENKKRFF